MDIEFYDTLFTLCVSVNDEILEKEKNGELTFIDHFAFQMTSYVISLIHDSVTLDEKSITRAFVYRCLIEIVAILQMYFENDIPSESEELLESYNYLCEYNSYKRYKDVLDGKQFDFNQIETNFKNTKNKYREMMNDKSSNEFNHLIKSKLPFLFQNYCFDELIKAYCENLYDYYKILSVFVHPNDLYLSYPIFKELDFKELEMIMFGYVGLIITHFYKNGTCKKNLKSEISFIVTNEFNNFYLNCATKQKEILFKYAQLIEEKMGENSQSYIFQELGLGIDNIALDKTFGFSEVVKCKFKPLVELAAMNHYIAKLPHYEDKRYLAEIMTKHTRYRILNAYGENTDDVLKDAYNLWYDKIEKIDFDTFKRKFDNILGFIPDGRSINKLVYDLIDDVIVDDKVFNAHMKMVYDESQMLSHANGYMISSNTGAFMEYSSVIPFLDMIISFEMNYYISYVKIYNESEGEHKYNKFIYDLNKQFKEFHKAAKAKNELDYKLKDLKVVY